MAVPGTKIVFTFLFLLSMIQGINCLHFSGMIDGFPEMYSLLDNVTSTANVAVRLLENQLEKQQQSHEDSMLLFRNKMEIEQRNHNKTIAICHNEMANQERFVKLQQCQQINSTEILYLLQNTLNQITTEQQMKHDQIINYFLQGQQNLLESRQDTQNEITRQLQNQQETLTQIAVTQFQMSETQTQIAVTQNQTQMIHNDTLNVISNQQQTLTRIADIQAQMANNQVVTLLQMQNQQQQNMTATLNNVVGVFEDQRETMKNISISLTTVLEQQDKQINSVGEKHHYYKSASTDATLLLTTHATTSSATPTTVRPLIQDCSDLASSGDYSSGVYTITPNNGLTFEVYCDMDSDGGGWTVFQKRFDGSVDFYREWTDFEVGFGNLTGEFWFGLLKMHQLTQSGEWILRVDLEDFDGNKAYAKYASFQVGNAISKYRLSIGSYEGTAGDSLRESEGRPFSTIDRDNDAGGFDCADILQGAGWYGICSVPANLNGRYESPTYNGWRGIVWYEWKSLYSLAKTEIKTRRVL